MFLNLLASLTPTVFKSVSEKLSCYRLLQIPLPNSTDSGELKSFFEQLPSTHKSLNQITEELLPHIKLLQEVPNAIYFNEFNWYLNFVNNDRGKFMVNWPQYITIYFTQSPKNEKWLLIFTSFTSAQWVERNLLMRNINLVLEALHTYFFSKFITIEPFIKSGTLYKDDLSKIDKNLSIIQIIFGLVIVLPVIAFILYLIFF